MMLLRPTAWLVRNWRGTLRQLLRVLGFGLFLYILSTVDKKALAAAIRQADVAQLMGAVALGFPFIWLKGLRWWAVLTLLGQQVPWRSAGMLYAVGLFAGYPTPGQVGEVAKVAYLRRYGCSEALGLISVVLDRSIDVLFLSLLALPGLGYFVPQFSHNSGAAFSIGLLFVAVCICVLFVRSPAIMASTVRVFRRVGISPASIPTLPHPARSTVLVLLASTVAAQAVLYARLALALGAIQVSLPRHVFVTGLAAVSLLAVLPITFAGIGTRDMALIVLFRKLRLTPALAILFSALVLLLHSSNALIGFLAWLVSERTGKPTPEAATSADVSVPQCVETQHEIETSSP